MHRVKKKAQLAARKVVDDSVNGYNELPRLRDFMTSSQSTVQPAWQKSRQEGECISGNLEKSAEGTLVALT